MRAQTHPKRCDGWNEGFNPRALAGPDFDELLNTPGASVSIHGPLRAQTGDPGKRRKVSSFNPRALAGPDFSPSNFSLSHLFQSTGPCGPRYSRGPRCFRIKVSIHGPLRAQTRPRRCSHISEGFNPRALAGPEAILDKLSLTIYCNLHII